MRHNGLARNRAEALAKRAGTMHEQHIAYRGGTLSPSREAASNEVGSDARMPDHARVGNIRFGTAMHGGEEGDF